MIGTYDGADCVLDEQGWCAECYEWHKGQPQDWVEGKCQEMWWKEDGWCNYCCTWHGRCFHCCRSDASCVCEN